MPIYSFWCPNDHETEMHLDISVRDSVAPLCDVCRKPTKRGPGGKGLLFFEEGRARFDQGLGGPPITSPADRARRMRQQGVTEGDGVVPPGIARNPKSHAMKRYLEKQHKSSWF